MTEVERQVLERMTKVAPAATAERNYLCVGADDRDRHIVDGLVARGLMRAVQTAHQGRDTIYVATDAGIAELKRAQDVRP